MNKTTVRSGPELKQEARNCPGGLVRDSLPGKWWSLICFGLVLPLLGSRMVRTTQAVCCHPRQAHCTWGQMDVPDDAQAQPLWSLLSVCQSLHQYKPSHGYTYEQNFQLLSLCSPHRATSCTCERCCRAAPPAKVHHRM